MVFPRKAAFKDQEGNYLSAVWIDDRPILTFDNSHAIVEHEIIYDGDRSIRVRSKVTGKFWRTLHNGYIVPDADTADDSQTLFLYTEVAENVVALSSAYKNLVCKKYIMAGRVATGFRSASATIEEDCHLEVEEVYDNDEEDSGLQRTDSMVRTITKNPWDDHDEEEGEPSDDSGLQRTDSMVRTITKNPWDDDDDDDDKEVGEPSDGSGLQRRDSMERTIMPHPWE